MAIIKEIFENKLKVYSNEIHQFFWISIIFLCTFFAMAVFRNYVDTAFLKRYGVEHIPLMLVINSVLTFFLFDFMNRVSKRLHDHILLSGFLTINAVVAAGMYFLIQKGVDLVYPVLFQLLYLLDSVLLVYLWNIAADFFDARQGKRIFPLITAFQVLGTTFGNFCTRPLTTLLGSDVVLLVFAGLCLFISFFTVKTAGKIVGYQRRENTDSSGRQIKLSDVPGLIKKYPILRYLIVIGLIPNILLPIFSYQFSIIANAAFPSEQSLISFLGFFRGGMTLTVFALLLIAGRVYARIGLVKASFIHPLNFTLLFCGLLPFFNIFVAAYGQLTIHLIQRTVAGPVSKILFNIVPNELRSWSRVFVRSTVIKVGMMFGALMMLALKPIMAPRFLSIIAAVLAFYWVYETIVFSRRYKKGLKQAIVEGRLDFEQIGAVCAVDYSQGLMQTANNVSDEYAQEKVVTDCGVPQQSPETALKLLADKDPVTRTQAALSLAYCRYPQAIRPLIALLDDREAVRVAAIEALAHQGIPVLAFLELALMSGSYRSRRGILEVLRLSRLQDFEATPFIGLLLTETYHNLMAMETLAEMSASPGQAMLQGHLKEKNIEILSLVFHALWVKHSDMRLMYEALNTSESSLAVELVETTVDDFLGRSLVPLIDALPNAEKIQKGQRALPLIKVRTPQRMLTWLAFNSDATTRMLAAYVIGESTAVEGLVPSLSILQEDSDMYVRQTAHYAVKRYLNEVADMPEIIDLLNKLKNFILFDGMGIRELQAIAAIAAHETYTAGEVVIGPDEDNFSLYLVLKGRVCIYKDHGTKEEQVDRTIGPYGFMGELRLFTGVSDNSTTIAIEPTDVLVIGQNHFQEIMKIYPQISMNLCLFFALRMTAADITQSKRGKNKG